MASKEQFNIAKCKLSELQTYRLGVRGPLRPPKLKGFMCTVLYSSIVLDEKIVQIVGISDMQAWD